MIEIYYPDGSVEVHEAGPAPVPRAVTPLQMRKALRQLGMMPTVQAFVVTQPEEVIEAWEYATQIERNNELIAMACEGLGLNDEQADDLFRLAATF